MADQTGRPQALYGRQPGQWEQILCQVLDERDHERLFELLNGLQGEVCAQAGHLEAFDKGPFLGRLVEQGRRLLSASPTDTELLEAEQAQERALWCSYRQRYREAFIPGEIHAYLKSCGAFVRPSAGGVQFEGFDKYMGHTTGPQREVVTLFTRRQDRTEPADAAESPPNFFSTYDRKQGRFIIGRAFRTSLPPGSGQAVLVEQVRTLLCEPGDRLAELVWDQVTNQPTYDALVAREGDRCRVNPEGRWQETPLGRVGARLIEALGGTVERAEAILDPFGFLDLVLVVGKGGCVWGEEPR
ncbi:MAG: hypothetical protein JW797_14535 [Bradymonadales bacterium]|nr:hypothetical protein [Bradymonadales bacterium]